MDTEGLVEELVADSEALIQRNSILTEFAESQVEERVRLARLVNRLAADRDIVLEELRAARQRLADVEDKLHAVRRSRAVRWFALAKDPIGGLRRWRSR